MRLIKFSNNAVSRLVAPITNASTTISMTPGDGAKFPDLAAAGSFFMATLIKADGTTEVVKVTARVSDTLTVVRAAEAVAGVTASYAFSVNDRIEQRLTAGALGNELDRLDAAAVTGAINKNTDYTVTNADVTMLIRVDSTAGLRTIQLPIISSLADDFDITVAKVTGDTNVVNVVRAGADTINGMVSYTLNAQWQSGWFVADRSTGTWTAINSGTSGSSITTDTFTVTGAPNDSFALSGYPGNKNNTAVYINGTYQQKATYTLSNNSLVVGALLPVGSTVECVWAQPVSVGVPSDGTVSTAKLVDGAVTDVKVASAAGIQSSKVMFQPSFAGSTARTLDKKIGETVSVKDFGAVGDGVTSDTTAFISALNSGAGCIFIPQGTYVISSGTVFDTITNVMLVGDGMGKSIIKLPGSGNLYFKGPSNVIFEDIGFKGAGQDGVFQTIWLTGFNGVRFSRCRFSDFGGATTNNAGSCALVLGAVDTSNSTDAGGDSIDASISGCVFSGNSRMTNFGVRVYTNWSPAGTAQCHSVRVENSHFDGFNWNAVEIAGPNTSSVIVNNCSAYACGLTPFDIDKGAHDCIVSNITINRLLGNIDMSVNPNTRITAVSCQGVAAAGPYAYNNIVENVTVRLLAADISAYNGYGSAAVAMAYAKNCTIRNIQLQCDAVPNRMNTNSPFALAAVCFATVSGVDVSNVRTANATAGIIEVEARDGTVGYDWCTFDSIVNVGTMTGHAISSTYGGATYVRYRFRRCVMSSLLSDCRPTAADKSLIKLAATSVGATAAVFEECGLHSATVGVWGVQSDMLRCSFDGVNIDIPAQANWFKSGGTMNRLHFGSNTYQGGHVDVSVAFANLLATCVAYQGRIREDAGQGNYGTTYGSQAVWHSTAAPTNPPVAYFTSGAKVNYFTPTAAGFVGLVATATGWKTYGAISA